MEQFYTLNQALHLWRKSKESRTVSPDFEKYLLIALRKYIIPTLYPELGVISSKDFKSYTNQLIVKDLDNAIAIFQETSNLAVENKKLSKGTQNNYYSVVKRFIDWMKQQLWWKELILTPQEYKVCPKQVKVEKKVAIKDTLKNPLKYGLTLDQLPATVREEIEEFKKFRLKGKQYIRSKLRLHNKRIKNYPKVDSVKSKTAEYDQGIIIRFLGWYVNQNVSQDLSLRLLTDIDLIEQYTRWLTQTRKDKYSIATNVIITAIAIAKWLNFDKTTERDWSDIPLVLDLQDLRCEYREIYQQEKQLSQAEEWKDKEISHKQAREIVQYLAQYCASKTGSYSKAEKKYIYRDRTLYAIAQSWQRYLIIKYLVYCPMRQEEIRNLKLNENLFRQLDEQGFAYYFVKLKEHKRSTYGRERSYRLPYILTQDLDWWFNYWRPLILDSVQTVEKWMSFFGKSLEDIDKQKNIIEQESLTLIENDNKLKRKEKQLFHLQNRVEMLPKVQENLNSHNYVFFKISNFASFGQPHCISSFSGLVTKEMKRATKMLYGEEKSVNPHAFRNIAEKHIRQLGKSDMKNQFATWIGHSEEMGDEYAAKITTDDDLTKDIVDSWWKIRK